MTQAVDFLAILWHCLVSKQCVTNVEMIVSFNSIFSGIVKHLHIHRCVYMYTYMNTHSPTLMI